MDRLSRNSPRLKTRASWRFLRRAILRFGLKVPKALLFVCVVNLISTTADIAVGKGGYNEPGLESASQLGQAIWLYAPYPWAGEVVGALFLLYDNRVPVTRNWFQLLLEIALAALLYCGRDILEWRLVSVFVADEISQKRVVGGVVLIAVSIGSIVLQNPPSCGRKERDKSRFHGNSISRGPLN